jgi:glycerate kinase
MSVAQAVSATRCGVLSAVPEVDRIGVPLADGGEATGLSESTRAYPADTRKVLTAWVSQDGTGFDC